MKQGARRAVTLMELLVTISVLAIALAIMAQFFMVQTRAANQQKALNEASEAARIALSLISWDLQNAGYLVGTKAIAATDNGFKDAVTMRYFDRTAAAEQAISYRLQGDPPSLFRIQNDVQGESVASIIAMNILYETRANQFELPNGSGSTKTCPAETEAIPLGATGEDINNCRGLWLYKDEPLRLVKQIKVQIVARSTRQIPGYTTSTAFRFDKSDGSTIAYTPQAGYVYQFAEQTIIAANLGR